MRNQTIVIYKSINGYLLIKNPYDEEAIQRKRKKREPILKTILFIRLRKTRGVRYTLHKYIFNLH